MKKNYKEPKIKPHKLVGTVVLAGSPTGASTEEMRRKKEDDLDLVWE